jgi:hypothetical protein
MFFKLFLCYAISLLVLDVLFPLHGLDAADVRAQVDVFDIEDIDHLMVLNGTDTDVEVSVEQEAAFYTLLAAVKAQFTDVFKNSIDYFKCVQHTGQNPETHHTTPSHRDWVTIDYKHTSQSIRSTLGRAQRPIPLPHPIGIGIYQYVHTGPLDGNQTHEPRCTISDPDHSTRGVYRCI